MYNNNDDILIKNFEEVARAFVNSVYMEFLSAIKYTSRLIHEDGIQSWIRKYVDNLRKKLQSKAQEYLMINRHVPTIAWLNKKVEYTIQYSLQEFLYRTEIRSYN
jgi:hypothetical protein